MTSFYYIERFIVCSFNYIKSFTFLITLIVNSVLFSLHWKFNSVFFLLNCLHILQCVILLLWKFYRTFFFFLNFFFRFKWYYFLWSNNKFKTCHLQAMHRCEYYFRIKTRCDTINASVYFLNFEYFPLLQTFVPVHADL